MKAAIIGLCVALAFTIGVALAADAVVERVLPEADAMRIDVLELVEMDRHDEALDKLTQLAEFWMRNEQWLEVFIYHTAVHEIAQSIVESHLTLKLGENDDFQRAMASLGEAIEHMLKEEHLSLSNVL
ncbi:MAG: DUF4363 family protein [Clostridiales bacterium]|nr:DUF4363 family protein [Clostridiales bacterium]